MAILHLTKRFRVEGKKILLVLEKQITVSAHENALEVIIYPEIQFSRGMETGETRQGNVAFLRQKYEKNDTKSCLEDESSG
ncbi:hypothetical protein MAR_003719 [Mya arenaria]|uniref:Uncharacterized protein n=1 Tax=Mya arenaria TaxID=6604 RepID=A0ABY7GB03_MYAAR|nr:hypothetical protein MAR_003719 [Mya arenaria]